jgi:hypothetical protein
VQAVGRRRRRLRWQQWWLLGFWTSLPLAVVRAQPLPETGRD